MLTIQDKITADIVDVLMQLTPDERVAIMRALNTVFCPYCGRVQPDATRCRCDEMIPDL